MGILTVTDSHDLDSRFVGLKFRRLPSVFNRGAVDCGVIKHPAAITNFLNIPLILQRGVGPGYRVLTQAVVILNPFAFSAEAHGPFVFGRFSKLPYKAEDETLGGNGGDAARPLGH